MRGAEWIRVDLHLHSPASSTFLLPSGLNLDSDFEKLSEQYVEETNIKIAAITDYNLIRADWFEQIKKKANRYGIIILPGIELDVGFAGG